MEERENIQDDDAAVENRAGERGAEEISPSVLPGPDNAEASHGQAGDDGSAKGEICKKSGTSHAAGEENNESGEHAGSQRQQA